jgi:tetratricopeptide (TPR) repeat protein
VLPLFPSRAQLSSLALGLVLLALAGCQSPATGNVEGAKGQASKARQSEAQLRRAAQAHAHYSAGIIAELNDDSDTALAEFEQAARIDPYDQEMVLEVTRRFLQLKKPEKALEILQAAASLPGVSGDVYARLGAVYAQLGRTEESLRACRKAIDAAPRLLAGYQTIFLNHLQHNQTTEAFAVLDQAARVKGVDAEFLVGVSDLYLTLALQVPKEKEEAHRRALATLERAQKADGVDTGLKLKMAEAYQSVGARDRATALYADALKELADTPEVRGRVRAKLAEMYLRGSDREKALELLQEIAKDDPTNGQAQFFLGSLAYEDKRFEAAADHFSKTILLLPQFEQAYYDLAACHLALNRTAEALATLDKARAKFAASFMLEYLNGMAFMEQKAYRQAVERFTAAEVIAEATAPKRLTELFYFQMGAAYERNGDFERAERYFEKCLALSPSFAEAQNYLGYMWAEQGRNLEKALELIRKAVAAEPENAAFLDSLGWVLFKLGRPGEALVEIEKSVKLNKEPDPTLYDHLGDIQQALGNLDKAREAWQKSLELQDDPKVRKKLEGK